MRRLLTLASTILAALALLALMVLPAAAQAIDDTGDFYEPPLTTTDVEIDLTDRTRPVPPSRSRTPGGNETGVMGSAPADLADTGMGVSLGAALAVAFVVLGGGALLVARRHDRSAV